MLKKFSILLYIFALNLSASSCWNTLEIAALANNDLNNRTYFSIKDSVTCKPVSYATFSIGTFSFKADKNGIVRIPRPPADMDNNLPIKIERDGYITANEKILVTLGSYWNNTFLMSKELPIHSARFVLSWGTKPLDLDLHLKSDNFHISFRNTKSIANRVKLDRDATKGYGPETITVKKLNKNSTYRVIVNRYSRSGSLNNKAQVRVYLNNKLDNIKRLRNTRAKCVEIATIRDNKISYNYRELNDRECR